MCPYDLVGRAGAYKSNRLNRNRTIWMPPRAGQRRKRMIGGYVAGHVVTFEIGEKI